MHIRAGFINKSEKKNSLDNFYKKGCNKGIWPDDFNSEMQKKETVSEDTHFNKYGAMLITQGLVKLIKESDSSQLDGLKGMLKNPDGIDIENM